MQGSDKDQQLVRQENQIRVYQAHCNERDNELRKKGTVHMLSILIVHSLLYFCLKNVIFCWIGEVVLYLISLTHSAITINEFVDSLSRLPKSSSISINKQNLGKRMRSLQYLFYILTNTIQSIQFQCCCLSPMWLISNLSLDSYHTSFKWHMRTLLLLVRLL